jgi:arylsulfatase A-like enzyme
MNKYSRRDFLRFMGLGAASLVIPGCLNPVNSSASNDSKDKPNIIFLMADDMGYGDLGCYGAMQIPTPNIDRLAAQGIRFTDAHSPSALCTPTRYGVLTGRYCWRTRLKKGVIYGHSKPLIEPKRLTVPSLLKQHGYETACIGKWHLGFDWALKDKRKETKEDGTNTDYTKPVKNGPLAYGFDYFFGISASLDMPPYCFIENDRTVGIPSLEKHPYNTLQKKGFMPPGWKDENVGPEFTRKAINFIENNVKTRPNKPFFLYLPISAPHTPCTPPDFIKGRSSAGVRGDMVTEVDWTAGQILDTLDRLNISENTLIIVTSDNGALTVGLPDWAGEPLAKYDIEHFGHKPNGLLRGQKADIYDGGHREPFIARWTGKIKPGSTSNELICLIDLMATCAAIVGAKLPGDAAEDSYNILPVLLDKKLDVPIREALVHHSGEGMFSIRQGRWKLVLGRGSGGFSIPPHIEPKPHQPQGQLYNLQTDPAETNNLWANNPQIVKHLTNMLNRYKKQGYSRPKKQKL